MTTTVARITLAPRERQILEDLADGSTLATVALYLKISFHMCWIGANNGLTEAGWLTTQAQLGMVTLAGGDTNSYPRSPEPISLPDWDKVTDRAHMVHRTFVDADGHRRSDTRPDGALIDAEYVDLARQAADHLRQAGALAATAGFDKPHQGGPQRIDRTYSAGGNRRCPRPRRGHRQRGHPHRLRPRADPLPLLPHPARTRTHPGGAVRVIRRPALRHRRVGAPPGSWTWNKARLRTNVWVGARPPVGLFPTQPRPGQGTAWPGVPRRHRSSRRHIAPGEADPVRNSTTRSGHLAPGNQVPRSTWGIWRASSIRLRQGVHVSLVISTASDDTLVSPQRVQPGTPDGFELDVALVEMADSAGLVSLTNDGCGSTCGACTTNVA